ncbi:helix-turn-helix domain-containing protein [uncultured Thomasclavelia sp.]|uniref:helix-turn-helix domain-containing protein n=1 Tax=uncultured Thomasclavelia sp. TaxID=3025759 RepID=UPI0025E902E8|nr:helix-turn-helix transcriptional regulator [uncultured Thomasclavelia sp.]
MNIEIANRLVKLRKENNLSQEALANKLGISRQAVSKWERAEASPDTDNLIMLAKIYNVSLDELLQTNQEEFESSKNTTETDNPQKEESVHVSLRHGIHVIDKDGSEVHVGWDGIYVNNAKNNDKDKQHYHEKDWTQYYANYNRFPTALIVIVIYIIASAITSLWHPLWIMLLVIPLIDGAYGAIKYRDLNRFPYPILTALYFLYEGFFENIWSPTWIIFLTIPVYYGIVNYFKVKKKRQQESKEKKTTR